MPAGRVECPRTSAGTQGAVPQPPPGPVRNTSKGIGKFHPQGDTEEGRGRREGLLPPSSARYLQMSKPPHSSRPSLPPCPPPVGKLKQGAPQHQPEWQLSDCVSWHLGKCKADRRTFSDLGGKLQSYLGSKNFQCQFI